MQTLRSKIRLEVAKANKQSIPILNNDASIIPEQSKAEWSGAVEEVFDGQSALIGKDKPVPYVAELTQTGVLTVRWDRKIEKIESFAALPQEKVMVKWSAEQ